MRRIPIILFLFFMFFVSVCCNWVKQEAQHKRFMADQEEGRKYFDQLRDKQHQQDFIHTRKSTAGRYEIFQDQQLAKNIFLLDTMDGRIWIIVEDKETKELVWQEINVENRDTFALEELFKNYK